MLTPPNLGSAVATATARRAEPPRGPGGAAPAGDGFAAFLAAAPDRRPAAPGGSVTGRPTEVLADALDPSAAGLSAPELPAGAARPSDAAAARAGAETSGVEPEQVGETGPEAGQPGPAPMAPLAVAAPGGTAGGGLAAPAVRAPADASSAVSPGMAPAMGRMLSRTTEPAAPAPASDGRPQDLPSTTAKAEPDGRAVSLPAAPPGPGAAAQPAATDGTTPRAPAVPSSPAAAMVPLPDAAPDHMPQTGREVSGVSTASQGSPGGASMPPTVAAPPPAAGRPPATPRRDTTEDLLPAARTTAPVRDDPATDRTAAPAATAAGGHLPGINAPGMHTPPASSPGAAVSGAPAPAEDGPLPGARPDPPASAPLAAPTAAPSASPVAGPAAPALAPQLALAARSLPDGPVEIRLSPPELGRVRLTLRTGEAGITVAVLAERGETLDLLRRSIGLLEQELRDLGYANPGFSFDEERRPMPRAPAPFAASGAAPDGADAPMRPHAAGSSPPAAAAGLDLRL